MTTTYHNNHSGGTAFDSQPAPPVGGVDRPSDGSNPTPHGLETRLRKRQSGGEGG